MKRGRVSLLTIFVIVGILALGALLAFSSSSESPETATVKFMDALARNDAKTLASVTFLDDVSQEELEKRWAKSCDYNEFYQFRWSIKSAQAVTDKTASATISMLALGSNETDYKIPLAKRDGKWLVDLAVVDRNFFPSLPKP